MKLVIGGVDRTSMLFDQGNSLALSDDMTSHGVVTLTCRDYSRAWKPTKGQAVQIYSPDDVTLFWAGSIDDSNRTYQMPYVGYTDLSIKCLDHNQIPTRFIAAEAYTGQLAGDIFADLLTKYLAADGVTAGTIDAGPVIDSFVVNYESVDSAWTRLTNLTGYGWRLDKTKAASFTDRATIAAPFAITDTETHCIALTVGDSRNQYRNRQYVLAGTDFTASRSESFAGDGVRRTFTTQFPVGAVPGITVNGVSKTVGIGGVETGKDWYWNAQSNQISQDSAGTVLADTDLLVVTYQGLFPVLAVAQDDMAIAATAAAEGGSGYYDHRDDQPSINTQAMAIDTARALIARYIGPQSITLTIVERMGLEAGQLLQITRTDAGLDDQYLITSIQASCEWADNKDYWTFRVMAVEGAAVGGWVQFFMALAAATLASQVTANEVLALLRVASEDLTLADSITVTSGGPETRIDHGTIGFMEVA